MNEIRSINIEENVAAVMDRVRAAALQAGRDPAEIYVVAATKMNDTEKIRRAVSAGIRICGENRVQEMLEKENLKAYDGAELHFIGHLQKNKVRNVAGLVKLIHGADSIDLLRTVGAVANRKGIVQDVLLEVNIGNEASKSGFSPDEIGSSIALASEISGIRVRGLMAIPPIAADGMQNCPFFDRMYKLFVDNKEKKYDNVFMDFLSMGMSMDFEAAIKCGSNMVRIGTEIFGPRDYSANK